MGAGNATMVIDETADVAQAARNTRISKTNDFGSGCSADGNLLVEASIYDAFLAQLQAEGGFLVDEEQKKLLQAAYWDAEGHRTLETIARPASVVAGAPASRFPRRRFLIVPESTSAAVSLLDGLGTVLAIFRYRGSTPPWTW